MRLLVLWIKNIYGDISVNNIPVRCLFLEESPPSYADLN